MDFAILQSGLHLSDVLVALHRFPSSHARPLFCLRWHLNGVGLLPPPAATTLTARKQGLPVGRRARGTWTATLDYVQKTLHLGALLFATLDGRSEYARDERSGLLVLPFACCAATPQRSDPSLNNPTCSLRAKPACCDFARLGRRISQHRFARSQRTPRYRLCTIFGAPDPLGLMSKGRRTGIEPLRKEARPLGPALWQLLSNPAEEPTQASTNRHSHARLQSTRQPRALHMTRIASRTARACLGTASAPSFFGVSDPLGIRPQGRHTGMKTE